MSIKRPHLLGRRIIHEGRVVRLELDRVMLPNGRRMVLELVRHHGSVVILAQPSSRHVILVRQYRYAIDRWIWELPAGSLEVGERPAAAARRECEEEIGLSPGRVRRCGVYFPTPGFCDELMTFYRCTELRVPKRPAAQDVDEQLTPRTFSLAEVRRLIARGRIVDMKTVVGLQCLGS